MKIEQLLGDLDERNSGQRWGYLVELSRSADPDTLRSLQDQLEQGDWFQQLTGLHIALIHKDEERVIRAMTSTSRTVSMAATRAAPKVVADSDRLCEVFPRLATPWQQSLLRSIGKSGDRNLAERLIPMAEELHPKLVALLLPACSEAVVAQQLANCEPQIRNWSGLGRRHPRLVLRHISRRMEEVRASQRQYLWHQFAPCDDVFARVAPRGGDPTARQVQRVVRATSLQTANGRGAMLHNMAVARRRSRRRGRRTMRRTFSQPKVPRRLCLRPHFSCVGCPRQIAAARASSAARHSVAAPFGDACAAIAKARLVTPSNVGGRSNLPGRGVRLVPGVPKHHALGHSPTRGTQDSRQLQATIVGEPVDPLGAASIRRRAKQSWRRRPGATERNSEPTRTRRWCVVPT